MTTTRPPAVRVLLVEPQNLLRRTVTAVARELDIARISEAASVDAAQRMLETERFDALIVAIDDGAPALDLLGRVRTGKYITHPAAPVAVMTGACDAATVAAVKSLQVRRILLKPFKVRGVLESIEGLCTA